MFCQKEDDKASHPRDDADDLKAAEVDEAAGTGSDQDGRAIQTTERRVTRAAARSQQQKTTTKERHTKTAATVAVTSEGRSLLSYRVSIRKHGENVYFVPKSSLGGLLTLTELVASK